MTRWLGWIDALPRERRARIAAAIRDGRIIGGEWCRLPAAPVGLLDVCPIVAALTPHERDRMLFAPCPGVCAARSLGVPRETVRDAAWTWDCLWARDPASAVDALARALVRAAEADEEVLWT